MLGQRAVARLEEAGIRGGFDWSLALDSAQGWPFTKTVAPLIRQ